MKRFMLSLPDKVLEAIDDLVKEGLFRDRPDFISDACRRYLTAIGVQQFTIKAVESVEEKPED